MDDNVVFKSDQSQSSGQPPPEAQANAPGIVQEAPPPEQTIVPEQQEATAQPIDTTASSVPETEVGSDAPPPSDEPPPQTPPPPISGGIVGFIMRKKKILIGIAVLLLLLFVIFQFLPKKAAPRNVELVWWGLWEDSRQVQPIINEFQRQYPHIKVKYENQSQLEYRERLVKRIENGQKAPDIFRFHNTWVPMLSHANVIQPLSSDVITPEDFKKNYYPVMQKDLVANGAIYGIPMEADTLALFVNTKIFEAKGVAVPTNWDDFVKVSKALTVLDPDTKQIKTAGAALGTYKNVTHAPDIIAMLAIQLGFTEKNKSETALTDAFIFYNSFTSVPQMGYQGVWDDSLDESLLAFSRGTLAMYFGYSWDIFRIHKLNKDLEFKTYPVPGLVGKNQSVASYWVEGVSSKSPYQQEAMLFLQYLAQKETAEKFYQETSKGRAFGEPHARVDLANKLKDNQIVYPFVSQLKNASSSYFADRTYDGEGGINTMMNTYLEAAITSIVKENVTPETAVKTLIEGIGQVMEKYGIK